MKQHFYASGVQLQNLLWVVQKREVVIVSIILLQHFLSNAHIKNFYYYFLNLYCHI